MVQTNGFTELSLNEMNEIDGGIPVWVVPVAKFVGKAIVAGVIKYGTEKALEEVFG
ncbi:MAG: hypothetical protein IJF07_08115 [Lachnospiraceae bacterium]|nr:hypothetical protein [Lachnospiraceae bacterium]